MKRIIAFAVTLHCIAAATSFAQRPSHYARIEIWGLQNETREHFIEKLELDNGIGAEAACIAVLKKNFGYKYPHVILFPHPSDMDSSTMLITLRDVPANTFTIQSKDWRMMAMPEQWDSLTQLGWQVGVSSIEFQEAPHLLSLYAAGKFTAISTYLDTLNEQIAMFGQRRVDSTRVSTVLRTIHDLRSFDPARAIEILLYAKESRMRNLATIVLLNHRDDPKALRALAQAIWDEDEDVAWTARNIISNYVWDTSAERSSITAAFSDGEILGAMLNHPAPSVCGLAIKILTGGAVDKAVARSALSQGATTIEEYLHSELTKHSEYATNFRQDAIEFLRKVADKDLGEQPEPWIEWLHSQRRK